MATLKQKLAAERKVREMIELEGVPMPDRIEYGFTCIRLFWDGPRVALVVDIDEPDQDRDDAPLGIDLSPGEG
jgi:hypothetical protein